MTAQNNTLFHWLRALNTKLQHAHYERMLESADVHKQEITIYY